MNICPTARRTIKYHPASAETEEFNNLVINQDLTSLNWSFQYERWIQEPRNLGFSRRAGSLD